MADTWIGFPLASGGAGGEPTDLQDFAFWYQFYKAIFQKHCATNGSMRVWPYPSHPWFSGTITAIDETSLQDSAVSSTCGWMDGGGAKRWVNYNAGTFICGLGSDSAPGSYQVIIHDKPDNADDYHLFFKIAIGDNDHNKLYFGSLLEDENFRVNWLGRGKTYADLIGKRYTIIKFAPGLRNGWAWGERLPEFPNEWEYDFGQANKAFTLTVDDTDFTLSVDGTDTATIAADGVTAEIIRTALRDAVAGHTFVVLGEGPFTILFEAGFNAALTADGATIERPAGVVYDFTKAWADDYWTAAHTELAGAPTAFDLMVLDSDGKWQRVRPTSSTGNSIEWNKDAVSWTINDQAEYYLIKRNGYWRSNQRTRIETILTNAGVDRQRNQSSNWKPFEWYRGQFRGYVGHTPLDELGVANVIGRKKLAQRILGQGANPCEEEIDEQDLFDVDVIIDQADECDGETIFQPHLWKTIRGLQKGAEETAPSFIDPAHKGSNAGVINPFNAATWFKRCTPAANSRDAVVSGIGETCHMEFDEFLQEWYEVCEPNGTAQISIAMPYKTPAQQYQTLACNWAMIDNAAGLITTYGTGTVTAGTLSAENYTFTSGDVGKQLVIAFGWSRRFARRFLHMYWAHYLEPDYGDTGGVVAVPTKTHPGTWKTRAPSTSYAERRDTGELWEEGGAYVVGEAAEYLGDDFFNPTYWLDGFETIDAFAAIVDKGKWEGQDNVHSAWFKPTRSGLITSSSAFSFTADARWWESTLVTWTGTATGGSDTTVIDNSVAVYDPSKPDPWINKAWDFAHGRWVDFIIEVQDTQQVWHKRLVTAYDPAARKITVNSSFGFSAAGRPYRISEPGDYRLNRLRDRKVKVIKPDGTFIVLTARANDNETCFFQTTGAGANLAVNALAGCRFEVIEKKCGVVYHWSGTEWLAPYNDAGVLQVPQDTRGKNWHKDQSENYPTECTGFGRVRVDDYIFASIPQELRTGLDLLWVTPRGVTVSSRANDLVAENNQKGVTFVGSNCGVGCDGINLDPCQELFPQCWNTLNAWASCRWTNDVAGTAQISCTSPFSCGNSENSEAAGLPYAESAGTVTEVGSAMGGYGKIRRYAYVSMDSVPTCFPAVAKVWARAGMWIWQTPEAYAQFLIDNPNFGPGCNKAIPSLYEFNTHGDGSFGFGIWGEVFTELVGDDGATAKYRIGQGSLPEPANPATPCSPCGKSSAENPLGATSTHKGYRITDVVGVIEWQFTYKAAA